MKRGGRELPSPFRGVQPRQSRQRPPCRLSHWHIKLNGRTKMRPVSQQAGRSRGVICGVGGDGGVIVPVQELVTDDWRENRQRQRNQRDRRKSEAAPAR